MNETVAVGTAENIEAEYGAIAYGNSPFVMILMADGEVFSVEGFSTKEAAKAALSDCHGVDHIEYLF